jgi:hypothetical protein
VRRQVFGLPPFGPSKHSGHEADRADRRNFSKKKPRRSGAANFQRGGAKAYSTIQGNGTALSSSGGGALFSYGNNDINDNGAFGSAPTVIGQH